MEEKKINVEVTATEVKNLLMRHLDIKQADSVANVIIGHMVQTNKGIPQLFKALIGIFPTAQYMPGTMIWIKLSSLSSWKYDMVVTKALPNVKDDCILAQIKDINIYDAYPYKVVIDIVKTGGKGPVQDNITVSIDSVVEKAEDFTDILDELEKLRDDSDLPF